MNSKMPPPVTTLELSPITTVHYCISNGAWFWGEPTVHWAWGFWARWEISVNCMFTRQPEREVKFTQSDIPQPCLPLMLTLFLSEGFWRFPLHTLIVTPKALLPSLISVMKVKVLLNLGQSPLDLKITQSLTISIHSKCMAMYFQRHSYKQDCF